MTRPSVTQPNAVVTPPQPARIILHREGNPAQTLVVDLQFGGTAENGVHFQSLSNSIAFSAGQSSREIQISARAAGLAGSTFVQVPDASGLRLVGEPLPPGGRARFYRLNLSLDPGQSVRSSMASLVGATTYGMSGNGNWTSDPATGTLVSAGGNSGETSRLIAQVSGPLTLDFEMSVSDGNLDDSLVCYLDRDAP